MKSWGCCMRKSRFRSQSWKRAKITIKRRSTISSGSSIWSGLPSVNSTTQRWRPSASQTLSAKSSCSRKSSWKHSRKPSTFRMNWLSRWTCTDGASSSQLISTHMSWSRKFSRCRNAWSPRLRKWWRKMCWFKRKRSFTLNWRIFWRSRVGPK